MAININGLSLTDPKITSASPIEEVWPRFKAYCEAQVPVGKMGCLVIEYAAEIKYLERLGWPLGWNAPVGG